MANDKALQPEQQIQGIKPNEYVSADKVLSSDMGVGDLPEGVKYYIKDKKINLTNKRMVVRLYELISEEGGIKLRRDYLENFGNRIPDEEEIALSYGPTKPGEEGYMWIGKWKDDLGEEKGIISEVIRISEKWRARYEAHQRKLKADSQPAPIAAPAPVTAGTFTALDMLAFMEKGEEKALRSMERMAAIMQTGKQEMPSAVMEKAYDAAGRFMEKSLESNFRMSAATTEIVKSKLQDDLEDDDEDDAPEQGENELQPAQSNPMEGLPSWIQPFIPQVEKWLGTLLGGGLVGNAAKTIIQSSDDWKQIIADPSKFNEAKTAMATYFGSDKTEAALNLLLDVKQAKADIKSAEKVKSAAKVATGKKTKK